MKDLTAFEQKHYTRNARGCEVSEVSGSDLDAILTMAQKRVGNPCAYSDDDRGLAEFRERSLSYLEFIRTQNHEAEKEGRRGLVPSVESWAIYLSTTRMTILRYERSRGVEWRSFIRVMKDCILTCRIQLADTGKLPPAVHVFDLCNNHNYRDVKEISVNNGFVDDSERRVVADPEEIAEKYRSRLADQREKQGDN